MKLNNKYKKILLTDNNGKDVVGSMAINEDSTSSIMALNQNNGILMVETSPGGIICHEIKNNGDVKRNQGYERGFINVIEPYKEEIAHAISQELVGSKEVVASFGLSMEKMSKASTATSTRGCEAAQFAGWGLIAKGLKAIGRPIAKVPSATKRGVAAVKKPVVNGVKSIFGYTPVKVATGATLVGGGAYFLGKGVGGGIESVGEGVGEGLGSVGEGTKRILSTEIGMGIDVGDALLLAGGIFVAKMIFDAYENHRKEKEDEKREQEREERQEERDQKFEDMMMQMQMNNNANR